MKVWILASLVLLLSGCAGMINDKRDVVVRVFTDPPGARLTLNANVYVSPASILVPRGEGDFLLTITKDGYQTQEIMIEETQDAWLAVNAMNLCVGCFVDLANGSGYSALPRWIDVKLQKE